MPTDSKVSPISREAAPQANSTTSNPRKTSPLASPRVLPCSFVISAAMSSMFSLIACWYRKRTRCLSEGVTYLQVPNASLAAATAAFISADVACGTCARTSWVAGFATSYQTSDFDSTNLPFIRRGTRGIDPFAPVLRRRIPLGTKLLRTTNFISKLRSRCSRKDVPRRPRMDPAFRLSFESASNYDDIMVQVRDAVKMSVDLPVTGRELSRQNWMPSTSAGNLPGLTSNPVLAGSRCGLAATRAAQFLATASCRRPGHSGWQRGFAWARLPLLSGTNHNRLTQSPRRVRRGQPECQPVNCVTVSIRVMI